MLKINRFLTWPMVILLLLMTYSLALAQSGDPPTPDTDAAGWLRALLTALTAKEWTPAVGLILLGLTYAGRRWLGGLVPWLRTRLGGVVLAFAIALGGIIGTTLAAGAKLELAVVLNALATSAAAGVFWEWLKDLGRAPAVNPPGAA